METDKEYAIRLAMEYGFTGGFDAEGNLTFDATFVEAVAEAVAKTRKATLEEMIYEHPTIAIKKAVEYAVKEEREACIHACREIYSAWMCEADEDVDAPDPNDCIRAIRARGQA